MPQVTVQGLGHAEGRFRDMAQRVRDLTPAMKVVARVIEKRTDDAFRASVSPAGDRWPKLADSTLASRASRLKGASAKKKGRLTAGAKAKRATLAKGAKPLIDTGRLRNSINVKAFRRSARFTSVGYLAPHMTGGKNGLPPKRNPTVFEGEPGRRRLIPPVASELRAVVSRYILGGRV